MIITDYKIVLVSNSPRRRELLSGLDIDYDVRVIDDLDETYPDDLELEDVAEFLAIKKASAYSDSQASDELIVSADTIVLKDNKIYGKPKNREEAIDMLSSLSGGSHFVITGVCLLSTNKQVSFSSVTSVTFGDLQNEEITYYVDKYGPYDKAGAYGIQEWIGFVGVKSIQGSYYNVMGLPINRLFEEIKKF